MPSLRIELAALALLLALVVGPAPARDIRILVQSSPLAGFQYYAGNARWNEMQVGDVLKLVREPDNPLDANAVRVEWHGEKLGYLPRAENRAVAAEMDRGGSIEARIAQLREHRNPWRRLLIDVYVAL
jgi:hypothetical protein